MGQETRELVQHLEDQFIELQEHLWKSGIDLIERFSKVDMLTETDEVVGAPFIERKLNVLWAARSRIRAARSEKRVQAQEVIHTLSDLVLQKGQLITWVKLMSVHLLSQNP